jgi:tagatose 1,6-diphosphate aldolase
MKQISAGKWRGLKVSSSANHCFSMLAFDQRGNYQKMLPEGTSFAQAADIKRSVVAALSPYMTAVLLDPNYGLPAVLDLVGTSGLLMALEKTGYGGDSAARGVDFMEGWTVAKIKRFGAAAAKLLVYYHPDTGEVAENIEAVVSQIAEECKAEDIAFFLEPLSYSPDPQKPILAEERPRIVAETARRLGSLGADVMKLEFPVDVKQNPNQGDWAAACEAITRVCEVPWILLSAGVDFEVFHEQVKIACQAGASGFLGGRAIWKEAVSMSAPERDAFLSSTGVERVKALRETTERFGKAWTEYFAPPQSEENWFIQY